MSNWMLAKDIAVGDTLVGPDENGYEVVFLRDWGDAIDFVLEGEGCGSEVKVFRAEAHEEVEVA